MYNSNLKFSQAKIVYFSQIESKKEFNQFVYSMQATRSDILDSDSRETIVGELKENTLYLVSVAALTSVGSKESGSIEVTTFEDSEYLNTFTFFSCTVYLR